jgi:hypothetical protein
MRRRCPKLRQRALVQRSSSANHGRPFPLSRPFQAPVASLERASLLARLSRLSRRSTAAGGGGGLGRKSRGLASTSYRAAPSLEGGEPACEGCAWGAALLLDSAFQGFALPTHHDCTVNAHVVAPTPAMPPRPPPSPPDLQKTSYRPSAQPSRSLARSSLTDMASHMALGRVSRPRGDGTLELVPMSGATSHMEPLKEGAIVEQP